MKQLEQLLKEKWFLVAADALVVVGILSLGLDPRDGFQAALAVLGILAAALIVVVPVLREDAGGKRRLAEQARLRSALAEEIDRVRDDVRASLEAANRRSLDAEVAGKKAGEVAAEAVARKASSELAALRAQVAATAEGIEELRSQVQDAANVARAAAADAEAALDQAELGGPAKAAADAATADLAQLRTHLAETRARAAADHQALQSRLERLTEDLAAGRGALDALAAKVDALPSNPSEASAPATDVADRDAEPEADGEVVEVEDEEEEMKDTEEAEEQEEDEEAEDTEEAEETEDEEVGAEPVPEPLASEPGAEESAPEPEPQPEVAPEPEPAPVARTVVASEDDATGTCLIVNLMIGIGNKPFVRGSGPGLSEDAGVPMQFLAIGRWLWRSPDASAGATVQVWKNDKAPLGEPVHVPAGETRELDEDFFAG